MSAAVTKDNSERMASYLNQVGADPAPDQAYEALTPRQRRRVNQKAGRQLARLLRLEGTE